LELIIIILNRIENDFFLIGIEVSYKKLNPQMNLPIYFIIKTISSMTILLGI